MADEGGLNEVLDKLRSAVDGVKAAAQTLIDKLAGITDIDLSDEIARVEALVTELSDLTAQIEAAVTDSEPTPPPTPAT